MISTGSLIWTSIRPLARTFLTVGAGFGLTKADLFPTEAVRGAAQVVLNIAMPCLLFSRIVPAFTPQNIGSLLPLTIVGLLYGIAGASMAWIIKRLFWVPHRFRYGVLAAGAWGNYGDIPTAIAMGITASAPFRGVGDENLAIAYISMLILLLFVTLFPLGGFLIIAKDFEGPDVESEELRETMRIRRKLLAEAIFSFIRLRRLFRHFEKPCDAEARDNYQEKEVVSRRETASSKARSEWATLTASSPTSTENNIHFGHLGLPESAPPTANHQSSRHVHSGPKRFLAEFLKPMPIVIVFAIVIALVNPLKALFLPPSTNFQPHFRPIAPDGQPPLAFILDTATFVGGASVPIGLVCLGSALAHLRVGSGKVFPQGAIATLALAKMVVTPILGVGITRLFVHAGFVHRDDKVLQFVCILFSGLPTSTTQVFLTQIYSPTGSVEDLSAFLVPQYIIMPFTLTGLVAYTLNYLF
ncbi:auxin efflux carrier [Lactifluus subvellereus]|nr:auxin efflux carrier [Lactifluus subvellereus]